MSESSGARSRATTRVPSSNIRATPPIVHEHVVCVPESHLEIEGVSIVVGF
jgi:hypothetical protein